MRKIAALLFAATAFAVAAQPAAADTTAHYSTWSSSPTVTTKSCTTDWQSGVPGGWGLFVDGCTVLLSCPPSSFTCSIWADSWIETYFRWGNHVTQNARLRVFNRSGAVVWFRDRSCAGANNCSNSDAIRIWGGEWATVQCNGVRQRVDGNGARNRCGIQINTAG